VLEAVEQAFAALDKVDCWHLVEQNWTAEEAEHRDIYKRVTNMQCELEDLTIDLEEAINPDPGPGQRDTPPRLR
jgi:hypothetical protein